MSTPHSAARVEPSSDAAAFASDVEYYLQLTPRQLPSRYLYDALGSALFDAICELPWYPITRAERTLLARHGGDVLAHLGSTIVELGPGSGEKLKTLLGARLATPRAAPRATTVHLVDVSRAALQRASHALSSLAAVDIVTHQATYETGLAAATAERLHGPMLTLFLGSNIGNFDPPGAAALLRTIRASLAPGDGLLIGTDLVKPERELMLAYDDPLGVTAAFNRNLLVRINRELEGDFDVDAFTHRAVWNGADSRVEMHLESTRRQAVRIRHASIAVEFGAGETIWTESSYKYRPEEVSEMLAMARFRVQRQWIDRTAGFALTLAQAE